MEEINGVDTFDHSTLTSTGSNSYKISFKNYLTSYTYVVKVAAIAADYSVLKS
jgi:hypothetical protein